MGRDQPTGNAVSVAEQTSRPTVGLVARENNADLVAGTILRAQRESLDVVVLAGCTGEAESISFAREMGCTIVEEVPAYIGDEEARAKLTSFARSRGYPGLLFVPADATRVDISATLAQCEQAGSYAVDSVTATMPPDGAVVVGIPAYNEAGTIVDVVTSSLDVADYVVVVDDGSSDDTARLAEEAGAMVVRNERNLGYGGALQRLFETVADWNVTSLVVLDGDGQHDPSDVRELVAHQREHDINVVIGSRFLADADTPSIPAVRGFGLRFINFFSNLLLLLLTPQDSWLSDCQSGFRAYDSDAVQLLATGERLSDGMGFSIDSLFVITKEKMSIGETVTHINYNVENPNTHNPISHGVGLVNNLIRIIEAERPMTFLGLPGFISLAIGVGFGYWTVINYIQTPNFSLGLSMTATFFTLLGVFMIFTGIILHALDGQ